MTDITFSSESIAAFAIAGILCIIIPVISLIVYKIKNKDIPVYAFWTGCGTFLVFALVLEQLLHTLMLPVVQNSDLLYVVYGALAAGVFEETGRFVAFKTILRKHTDPRTSVMYGLGHGGVEAIFLVGISMLSYISLAVMTNSMGAEAVAEMSSQGNAETAALVMTQLEGLSQTTIPLALLSVFERIVAITFHTAISVLVFEAARVKGRVWLYPVSILLHALLDVPAAMYQRGIIGIVVVYVLMIIIMAAVVFAAVRSFKRIRANNEICDE